MIIKYLVYIIFIFILTASNSSAEQKIALLIGNSDYQFSPLKNPCNDARDFSQELIRLGFKTTCLTDATQEIMIKEIGTFEEKLNRKGGVGLFYYAGHAVQYDDQNYLIPVDAQLKKTISLSTSAIKLQDILMSLDNRGTSTNIIILDACRNNPFQNYVSSSNGVLTRSAGRAVVIKSPKGLATINTKPGSFIAYATAPGMEADDGMGRNGIYTKYILKHIRTEGQSIEELFKKVRAEVQRESNGSQIPWERSSLLNEFYFVKAKNGGKRRVFGAF
ncbi:hypothetical protein JCM14469_41990 [Desulfatiferula olefinivorans]